MATHPPAEPSLPSEEDWAAEPAQAPTPARLQPWQVRLLLIPLALLAACAVGMWQRNPELFSLLWRDPMGIKMAFVAAGAILGGSLFFLGGCVLLNRFARVPWSGGATFLQAALVVAWLMLFCAPAAFVVTIGPAAIDIQRNLRFG